MTPKLILLVGLPGSGKSTYAANHNLPTISSDRIRELLLDDVTGQSANGAVFSLVRRLVTDRLKLRRPLTCVDATNLTPKERRPYRLIAARYGASIEAVCFNIPLEVCKERNRIRHRNVPEEIMDRMAARLRMPSGAEGYDRIFHITQDSEK